MLARIRTKKGTDGRTDADAACPWRNSPLSCSDNNVTGAVCTVALLFVIRQSVHNQGVHCRQQLNRVDQAAATLSHARFVRMSQPHRGALLNQEAAGP